MPKARPHGRSARNQLQVERLEGRQLLSGEPWSASAKLIGQDQAAVNYPSITGAGESVVIIDSGVDYKHPALGGGFGAGFKVEAGWDFINNDADPFPDTFAHGTGTAGGVAANGYVVNGTYNRGVAPGVNLIALRETSSSQVKAALQWVLDNRAKYNIVAVSMVDYGGQPNTFKDVFKKVVDAGIFVAHPSGNGGPGVGVGAAIHPADFAIGSVNVAGQMSSFTQRGAELDLLAPGENVAVTYYDVKTKQHQKVLSNGTSWATPAVVGTAALIKQVDPRYTPAQVMQIMQDSGASVYDAASNRTYKRLNVNAAIGLAFARRGQAQSPSPTPTPTPSPTPTPAPVPAPTPTPKPTPSPTPTPTPKPPPPPPPPPPKQAPFNNAPARIVTGAIVQAENFDAGGEGLAYHDTEAANLGKNTYRPNMGVDVESSAGGGRDVAYVRAGEWVEYTVSVATAGTYTLTARVASATGGGTFHVEVDGVNKTGAVAVPKTGGPHVWGTVAKAGVALAAGTHVLRVRADSAGADGYVGNLDSITFTLPPPLIDATKFTSQRGVLKQKRHIGGLAQGDWVGYKGLDFGAGSTQFKAMVAAPKGWAGQRIEVRLGSNTGSIIGVLTVRQTPGWEDYAWQAAGITKTSGVHDVFLTFSGTGWVGNVRAFQFA